MGKRKEEMNDNPLFRVYMVAIPLMVAVIAVIYLLVRLAFSVFGPDEMTVVVTYHDYEKGAILKEPMRVASDKAFTEELNGVKKKKSGFMDDFVFWETEDEDETDADENGTYTFQYEYRDLPDTLYVQDPVWWYPVDTKGAMAIPLKTGEKTDSVSEWGAFEITEVRDDKITSGVFNVTVTITGTMDAVPSEMKLNMGGYIFEEWDGSTEVAYDDADGFASRTVVFRFNKDAREDISDLLADAKLIVQEYTVRKTYTDREIVSGADDVQFVGVN